jgi:hypothetical protein
MLLAPHIVHLVLEEAAQAEKEFHSGAGLALAELRAALILPGSFSPTSPGIFHRMRECS